MNVVQTFGFVILRSARNRVVAQVKRLKQPRYLVATLLGLAYWYLYLGRGVMRAQGPGSLPTTGFADIPIFLFTALGGVSVLSVWIFGTRQSTLAFTEAEIQFFFPAPATRRALLNYKLLKSALVGLLTTAFFTLVFGRAAGGNQAFFVVGLWLGVTTLSFHSIAAARTRQRLTEHGRAGWLASLPTLVVLAVVGLALWWSVKQVRLPPLAPGMQWLEQSLRVLQEPPLGWLVWPIATFGQVMFAPGRAAFFEALPGAAAILGLHYVWVVSGDVPFEESSVRAAEKRAAALEARRTGQGAMVMTAADRRRPPFVLAAHGPPEVALIWKGLIATGRLFNKRTLILVAVMLIPIAVIGGVMNNGAFAATMTGFTLLMFWTMSTVLGGSISRSDLRRDIEFIDVLRAMPMSGRQIVIGEALGALVPAVVVQWGLLFLGLVLIGGDDTFFSLDWADRVVWGVSLGVAGPAVTLAGILVQNAAVIFVPAWVANPKQGPQGPEASGVAMLILIGTLLGISVGLLPALLFAALVGFAVLPLLGTWSLLAGALALAGVAAVEAWFAAAILGKAFEVVEPGA